MPLLLFLLFYSRAWQQRTLNSCNKRACRRKRGRERERAQVNGNDKKERYQQSSLVCLQIQNPRSLYEGEARNTHIY